jgi:hypothetical protein
MKRRKHIAPVAMLTRACTVLTLIACHWSPASAEPAPPKRCAAISSQEYAAAKKKNLLRGRFGSYVRTGRLGRRQYWYCHA